MPVTVQDIWRYKNKADRAPLSWSLYSGRAKHSVSKSINK